MANREAWRVSREIVTPESAEHGDYESCEIEMESSFREAMDYFNAQRDGGVVEADSWPVSAAYPPRSFRDCGAMRMDGSCHTMALHIPDHVTPSSRMRVARMLRCCGIMNHANN